MTICSLAWNEPAFAGDPLLIKPGGAFEVHQQRLSLVELYLNLQVFNHQIVLAFVPFQLIKHCSNGFQRADPEGSEAPMRNSAA